MPNDHVRCMTDDIVKRVAKYGRRITRYEATPAAWAMDYLRRCGLRVPTTLEQARALDPRAQQASRVLCTAWSNWVDGPARVQFERIKSMLASIEQNPPNFTRSIARSAPGPICGWSSTGPRGICTKRDWRQKAAG